MGVVKAGLAIEGLRVVFDDFVAVDDVSLRVEPGESFGIVGESGSGKSTVLRAVCGLAPRTAGSVALIGSEALPQPGHAPSGAPSRWCFRIPTPRCTHARP